jgi:hypothetical protein
MRTEISLNNPGDVKLLKRLGMITEFKKYLADKLLKEAYSIINPPTNENDNKKL